MNGPERFCLGHIFAASYPFPVTLSLEHRHTLWKTKFVSPSPLKSLCLQRMTSFRQAKASSSPLSLKKAFLFQTVYLLQQSQRCQDAGLGRGGFSLYRLQEPSRCLSSAGCRDCCSPRAAAPLPRLRLPSLQPCSWPCMDRPDASSCSLTSAPRTPAGAGAGWGREQPQRDRVVAARARLSSPWMHAGRDRGEFRAERKGKGGPVKRSGLQILWYHQG